MNQVHPSVSGDFHVRLKGETVLVIFAFDQFKQSRDSTLVSRFNSLWAHRFAESQRHVLPTVDAPSIDTRTRTSASTCTSRRVSYTLASESSCDCGLHIQQDNHDYYLWAIQRPYERDEDRLLKLVWDQAGLVYDADDTRDNPLTAESRA